MALNWKDFVATILAILVAGFSYFMVTGYKFPLISGYRWATLVLLIIGIGMCALSSANQGGPWITLASILGVITLILIIASFIMGTKTIFIVLSSMILLLWAVATIRHLIGR